MTSERIKFCEARVMHARLRPKKNKFIYDVPFFKIDDFPASTRTIEKKQRFFFFWTLRYRDYGYKNSLHPILWARRQFDVHKIKGIDKISLITQLRFMGFGFNPISFYCGVNRDKVLIAVLCEVKNTFSGVSWYLIHDENGIDESKSYQLNKKLFVSPFYQMKGYYRFRFDSSDDTFKSHITYFPDDNPTEKPFFTSMKGTFAKVNPYYLFVLGVRKPLLGFRTIFLIHWQAFKLFVKGIPYFAKTD